VLSLVGATLLSPNRTAAVEVETLRPAENVDIAYLPILIFPVPNDSSHPRVQATRHQTLSDREFPVTTARAWIVTRFVTVAT